MAGTLTRGVTIAAAEPISTLGPKLAQLASLATFNGFSDDESDTTTIALRTQSTVPTATANDFWSDTTARQLRPYDTALSASADNRWPMLGRGESMINGTAGTRVSGDVVGFSGTPNDFTYNADATNPVAGVVKESTSVSNYGGIQFAGICTVKADGTVVRGDFLGKSGSAGNIATDIGGLANSFGIALTTPSCGVCTAYLWGYNA